MDVLDVCQAIKELVVALDRKFTHRDVINALAASGLLSPQQADTVLNIINGVV